MLETKDVLAFKGQLLDVEAITKLLVSWGFFCSAELFNTHMRSKLVSAHFVN
jgi:hypothetical protein